MRKRLKLLFCVKYMQQMLLYSIIVVPILAFVDSTSIFSYLYALFVIALVNVLICNSDNRFVLFCYHYYLLFGILVYLLNRYQLPSYIGTTGPMGIGTDDYTFYGQIVDGNVPYELEVPYKYPFSFFIGALYPFNVSTPLNIVLFNIIFVSYLPYYTGKLSDYFFKDSTVSKFAKILILLCPMTTMYGVIIIRDLLVTTLVIASIYYYLTKQYIPIVICVAIVFYVRFGSVSFIASSFLLLYILDAVKKKWGKLKVLIISMAVICLFVVLIPILQEYSGGKLSAGIIRAVDGEYYEGSTIASIMMLPFPINIVLSSIFFAIAPLLTMPTLVDGVFVIINFFNATLTPLFLLFISSYLYNSIIKHQKDENHKKLLYLLVVFLVVLGTVSLQIRHKNIIFPLLCIIAAYGYRNFDKSVKTPTIVLTSFTIVIELSYALYVFFK